MQINDLKILDQLVRQSQEEYEEIYSLLLSLGQLDSHPPDEIRNFHESLLRLQKTAQRTDDKITKQLKCTSMSKTIAEQLRGRTALQQNILALVKETASRANSVKSLLASEMQVIRHGRNALTGYRSNSPHQGRIVDKRS